MGEHIKFSDTVGNLASATGDIAPGNIVSTDK